MLPAPPWRIRAGLKVTGVELDILVVVVLFCCAVFCILCQSMILYGMRH